MAKLNYNTLKYRFRELVCEAFEVDNLENLHESKIQLMEEGLNKLNIHNENSTKFHKEFYKKLNDNWVDFYTAYESFIHNEIVPLLDEKFHYQYLPTFRVQLPFDNQAVHTWHYDSDQLHKHPEGEINFWMPLTSAYDTNTMWAESEPRKLDFKPIEGGYGDYWMLNLNKCLHGNKPNKTSITRVSLDFRIIPLSKYDPSFSGETESEAKKFILGSYYKELNGN